MLAIGLSLALTSAPAVPPADAAPPRPVTVVQRRECRDPDWCCVTDPCTACTGLCSLPGRALLVAIMVPLLVYKPKCTSSSPDLGSLALWLLFGVPQNTCWRPPPGPPAPAPAQPPPASQPRPAPVALRY